MIENDHCDHDNIEKLGFIDFAPNGSVHGRGQKSGA